MPPDDTPELGWSILVYRVGDEKKQQRILAMVEQTAHPGLVALESRSAQDWLVIVECRTFADQVRARQIISAVDPEAERDPTCELTPEQVRTRRR
jgi:hypothetical protein